MGESNIRMIHLLLSLAVTNDQQSISFKSSQHCKRKFDCGQASTVGCCIMVFMLFISRARNKWQPSPARTSRKPKTNRFRGFLILNNLSDHLPGMFSLVNVKTFRLENSKYNLSSQVSWNEVCFCAPLHVFVVFDHNQLQVDLSNHIAVLSNSGDHISQVCLWNHHQLYQVIDFAPFSYSCCHGGKNLLVYVVVTVAQLTSYLKKVVCLIPSCPWARHLTTSCLLIILLVDECVRLCINEWNGWMWQ